MNLNLPPRRLCSIERLTKRRAVTRLVHAFGVRSAAGRRANRTFGPVSAALGGIPSIPEECARPAYTSGLKPSACPVADGRRIRSGMQPKIGRYPMPTGGLSLNIIQNNRRIAEQFNVAVNRGDLHAAAVAFPRNCQNHGGNAGRVGV